MTPAIPLALHTNSDVAVRHASRPQINLDPQLRFKPVDFEAMVHIWPLLALSPSRTCDFSYGGLLIWAPLFGYEYAVTDNSVFIRGRLEGDFAKTAFSLPAGEMPLGDSLRLLGRHARLQGECLRLSAVPEYALPEIMPLKPSRVVELPDWADYMYDITVLATLTGKKMAKKRNHVNKFEATFPDAELRDLTAANIPEALQLLKYINASAPDVTDIARAERQLCADTLALMAHHDTPMRGAILYANGKPAAFTVGDIKGDTLFIHIEKADRAVPGAYEAINKYFASRMLAAHPELRYVNREDDAGDPGLRYAKRSYHPLALLKKFDVTF